MLEQITTLAIFHFFLIFCRVGTMMMLMPGFGEIYVSPSIRLLLAFTVSLVITPPLENILPILPSSPLSLFVNLASEIMVGILIGGVMRMIQGLLHVAGMIIAFQSSLASALLFDANQASQGSVIGNFITLIGVTLLFTSNMHHLILAGVADSYSIFNPAVIPDAGDFALLSTKVMSSIFIVALKIASPLIVVGLCLYLASGMMARLMPSMQVFFVIIPAQLYVSFSLLMMTISAGMMWYLNYFEEILNTIFVN